MRVSMTWPQYLRGVVVIDGKPHKFGPITSNLIAALVMNRGRPLRAGELVSMVWEDPDEEPEYPENLISRHVERINKRLGFKFIVSRKLFGYSIPK